MIPDIRVPTGWTPLPPPPPPPPSPPPSRSVPLVLKVLVFLVVFVIMLALPPLGFALAAFLGYTLYFYKKG